jgi:hypothetical protein
MNAISAALTPNRRLYRLALLTAVLLLPSASSLAAQDADGEPAPEYNNWVQFGLGGAFIDGNKGLLPAPIRPARVMSLAASKVSISNRKCPRTASSQSTAAASSTITTIPSVSSSITRTNISSVSAIPSTAPGMTAAAASFAPAKPGSRLPIAAPFTRPVRTPRRSRSAHARHTPRSPSLLPLHPRGFQGFHGLGRHHPNRRPGHSQHRPRLPRDGRDPAPVRSGRPSYPGPTTLGLGFRYEIQEQDNTLNLRRNPGEPTTGASPNAIPSTPISSMSMPPPNPGCATICSSPPAMPTPISTPTSPATASTVLPTIPTSPIAFPTPILSRPSPVPPNSPSTSSTSTSSTALGNPWPSSRPPAFEKQDITSHSRFAQPAQPLASNLQEAASDRGLLNVSEAIELRYTGFTNWVFSTRGYWLQGTRRS